MSDIEQKALALAQGIRPEDAYRAPDRLIDKRLLWNALCRTIEQHEAFKQKVSDIVSAYVHAVGGSDDWEKLNSLIIPAPKPDPLVEVLKETYGASLVDAAELRAALEARGLEIREKG